MFCIDANGCRNLIDEIKENKSTNLPSNPVYPFNHPFEPIHPVIQNLHLKKTVEESIFKIQPILSV